MTTTPPPSRPNHRLGDLAVLRRRAARVLVLGLETLGFLTLAVFCVSWVWPGAARPLVTAVETTLLARTAGRAASAPSKSASTPADPAWRTVSLDTLPKRQAAVARWLGARYHVVPEAIAALVVEANHLGPANGLPPNLILAMVAIESNFHPYIESGAGAQGLMQILAQYHSQRYDAYGGPPAAFDPRVNMRVGVEILREAIRVHKGSVDDGLRYYSGGSGDFADLYVARVRAVQSMLDAVAAGRDVSPQAPLPSPHPAASKPHPTASKPHAAAKAASTPRRSTRPAAP